MDSINKDSQEIERKENELEKLKIELKKKFIDLRYIDWNTLFSQLKTILPLHIVQNLA
jgi:hypothetical protein